MDLLGGYGSSSDEEGGDPAEPALAAAGREPKEASASAAADNNTVHQRRRGKKILSLAAVLPPHILEQLTRDKVVGGGAEDGSSSDEEEQDETGNQKAFTAIKTSHDPLNPHTRDSGLSQLLSELHGAPTTAAAPKKKKPSTPQTEKMGAAFLSTTTTTTDKKSCASVLDIHGDSVGVVVGDEEDNPAKPSITSSKPAAASVGAAATQPSVASSSLSMGRSKVTAAPLVNASSAPLAAAASFKAAPMPKPAPSRSAKQTAATAVITSTGVVAPTAAAPVHKNQKKRSRKDMERALRQGNLAALDEEPHGMAVVEHAPEQTVLDAARLAPPVDVGGSSSVKVVPTSLYDPSVGGTTVVMGKGGKGSGKNQINSLLAQAASLEQARSRQAAFGASTDAGKRHRANAKQKYGW